MHGPAGLDAQDAPAPRRVAVPHALSLAALFRPGGELQLLDGLTMGTSWRVGFLGAHAAVPAAQRAIVQILDRVTAQFSPWEANSELNRFNATQPGTWHAASSDFARVVGCALQVAADTGGACDPALGTLVDLWGFGPAPRAGLPSAPEIEAALQTSGWHNIAHDRTGARFSRKAAARLDLCGVAKGYAVDLIARSLRDAGIAAALVEIGGELSGYGIKPDGTPWWVAIDGGDGVPILVALHGLAIATSGCERSFAHDGKSYSHTIDGRTGCPIDNGMVSATVLHESCMRADAYATALLVMGPEAAIAFAEEHQLTSVIRYRAVGATGVSEYLSTAMQTMIDA